MVSFEAELCKERLSPSANVGVCFLIRSVGVLFYSPELVVEEVFKSHPLQGVKASCETVRCQTSASGFGVTCG